MPAREISPRLFSSLSALQLPLSPSAAWAFGEHKYSERKALVDSEGWTGPAFQTCMNTSNVCKRFETNRRRLLLPFSHHVELAALPPDEADELLDWCEEPLKNGRKKAKSIRELHQEMARRDNASMEERGERRKEALESSSVHLCSRAEAERGLWSRLLINTRVAPSVCSVAFAFA
jgi:hypothetical protein